MENITIYYGRDNENSVTTAEIMAKIETACINHGLSGLQDLHDVKTGQFGNILRDVGDGFFKPNKVLKQAKQQNYYDIEKLKALLDLYIYLCIEYDKAIYINNYYSFAGLSDRYINAWNYNRQTKDPTNDSALKQLDMYARKIIEDADAMRIGQRASDSKQAILNIAYANYRHNWNGQIKAQAMQTTVKTLADLKQERQQIADNTPSENGRFTPENI